MSDADAPVTSDADDWAAKAATTVVGYVDTVRNATTGKALVASRSAVYFLAIGLLAIVTLFLLLIVFVRFMVNLTGNVPGVDPGEVWLAYLIIGALFSALGMFMWVKKGR